MDGFPGCVGLGYYIDDMDVNRQVSGAISRVLELDSFSELDAASLLDTERFSAALRAATGRDLHAASADLEAIANAGDNPAEGSGFLTFALAFADPDDVGVVPDRWGLHATDSSDFARALVRVPDDERTQAGAAFWAAGPARARRVGADVVSQRHHAHILEMMRVALSDEAELLIADDDWTQLRQDDSLANQVSPFLWEVLGGRGEAFRERVTTAWWGPDAQVCPSPLVLLEWMRHGWVEPVRTHAYMSAAVAAVVWVQPQLSEGEVMVERYPWLKADALAGMGVAPGFAWLNQDPGEATTGLRVTAQGDGDYLRAVAHTIDEGLTRGWGGSRRARENIAAIRDGLVSP